tara:strand:- start:53601 stop:54200 length:600 start_codon:yes stop_codon:yes gene_type:complete
MPTMEIIRFAELTESNWKNGGGITREIACATLGENRIWRLSMADVTRDGSFSEFAEYVRILTVVKGQGMVLHNDGGSIDADPWIPVQFSGALRVNAQLKSGPLTDLNLMFNSDYCNGDVTVLHGPCNRSLALAERRIFAVHSLAGAVQVNGCSRLLPGDTAIIGLDVGQVDLADGDAALLVQIEVSRRINPNSLVFTAR